MSQDYRQAGHRDPAATQHPRPPLNRGAVAGTLLVASILLGAGVGAALGALVGALVPLGLVGLFAGVVAGFFVVRGRFREL